MLTVVRLFVRPIKLISPDKTHGLNHVFKPKLNLFSKYSNSALDRSSAKSITQAAAAETKRIIWKKKTTAKSRQHLSSLKQQLQVVAYSTADYYDLSMLKKAFVDEGTYDLIDIDSTNPDPSGMDILCLKAKYNTITSSDSHVHDNSRFIFIFEAGTCVLWNINDLDERNNIFNLVSKYTTESYDETLINNEMEILNYSNVKRDADNDLDNNNNSKTLLKHNHIYFKCHDDERQLLLEKYTFSDAISLSVKLGILENKLENFIDGIEHISHDLKSGKRFKLTSSQVLQKTGELMTLRHLINLRFDLLNTPDWYWDREKLESLYLNCIQFLDIGKRTRVFNEKLNHCIDLMRLLESNLNEKKHTRLEWCIIILIMVEAFFGAVSFFNNIRH